ncbi:tRNA (adenine(22)-N(1))-methyltransferase TrmK [Thermoclostridium stercorarium subsp. stercorarium DSM 8532]|uniref:tRNA (Adenine(22)-N(1))-methyltransferase TrmK n=4 Tax=Thermoclostridium stercorarium TaxID=1510 RepID=L7VMV7_THES1|nr:class I SAM-dependent methyltransferase [Thermoclostridium stercorarium]AGC67801.1 tRNA (adenine(22)-N(1))-methyltransferase TrmK [Thermoclostridium stercorarium subsp. stercorarium DSM 8532]AGI38845.1 methyltransferase [Thermoclostridium stercorarium subsp. stercorarium DSM 8532]ANW98203.1 tRNA (adenine-N1)-methyltransferase [Thermoclostridium stercorarium subsp. thermolacticum DSM 2910]ANX00746.1 tRNA (adenine-N1)-methyltransferase [Thermoclostridium stercorarium subsp. leptospartum DSM 92
MIKIGNRLLKIASMVGKCEKPADIGTDHAYIPIYLVQAGMCGKAVATDVREGPLMKARKNIEKYRLSDRIELRMGDGLKPIGENECDVFIIAGIGGVVMTEILETSLEKAKKAKALILQPAYYDEVLREYLYKKGFCIETEALAEDEGRMYAIIRAYFDGIARSDDDLYYHIGRSLFVNRDPLLGSFLQRRIRIQTNIVNGMRKSAKVDEREYLEQYNLLVKMKKAYEDFAGN